MSPAPRFSTADIAKGAQERKDERIEQEREAERAERDRTSAPHITGSEPMQTSSTPITAAANPITAPGPAMPPTDGRPVRTPLPGSGETDAATIRQETRAERETDAAIARAATAGTTGATSATNVTNTERQLAEDSAAPLFATDAATNFRQRWDSVQAGFVDDPRRAVEDADALVAETMQRLAETFAQERKRLEQEFARQPDAGGTASAVGTEELRIALRHYRSFFKRLLSV